MLSKTARTTIKKGANKACLNANELYRIIDESLLAHVAIIDSGLPVVIPMLAWRIDDKVYVHGARNSRLLRNLKNGELTCLTFTLFDGWVLARSAMHHSAHYRSAVVFGQFDVIDNNQEKDRLLNLFVEQIAPGRTEHIRLGNEKELTATELLSISLDEASVKIANNGVNDDRADLDIPVWAGVLPYRTIVGPLQDTPDLADEISQPDYSAAYGARWYNSGKQE